MRTSPDNVEWSISNRFPVWQSVLVLVVWPCFYILKDNLPVVATFAEHLPLTIAPFIERPRFVAFWSIVLLLHAGSVLLVFQLLKINRLHLDDIGLRSPPRKVMVVFGVLFVFGIGLVFFRTYAPMGDFFTPFGRHLPDIYAINFFQRCCWVIISLSAGFCEELVYRGFGINALVDRGVALWVAVMTTSASFACLHGLGTPTQMITYLGAGILFASIYIITKNLLWSMAVHAAYDLLAIIVQ